MELPTLPVETTDFSDLDAMIAESEQEAAARSARERRRREATGAGPVEPPEVYQWITVHAVALFHTQTCRSCSHKHRFFMGWMTAQQHRTDPNCRRLLRGMPAGAVERRIEEHSQPEAELCGDCAEATLMVMSIVDNLDARAEGPGREAI